MSGRRVSPRNMRRMMKNLKVEEIDAEEVIIRTRTEEIVISNPTVNLTNMQGVDVFQIIGSYIKRPKGSRADSSKPSFDASSLKESDIELVAKNAKATLDEAREALVKTRGDLAAAVMLLRSKK